MNGKKLECRGENALIELGEVQEIILREISERNRGTVYLKTYLDRANFDLSAFKRHVPVITYAGIRPYTQKIANGANSSLISGQSITEMLISWGTSGGEQKLMPSIAEDLDRRTYVYNLIMPIMNQYRIGDVLQVVGFYNQAPQFRFICLRNVILSIDFDKMNEEELHKRVSEAKKLLDPHDSLLVEYTSYADNSTLPGHYVLYWEIAYTSSAAAVGEEVLLEFCASVEEPFGFIYQRCRASDRSVGALEMRVVEGGTFDSLMDLFIGHGGGLINQYKTPRCIKSSSAFALLESKVLGSFLSPRVPSYSP